MNDARRYLDLAARLATRGLGDVEPNPPVGAVLVRTDQLPTEPGRPRPAEVIGCGHHHKFGGLHAEREALADCARRGNDPRGSTLYCTLEPCLHHGKQPPCTDALIEAGVARVVYARPDPHANSGGGCAVLKSAGIESELCLDSPLATHISDPFVHCVRTGLPWVTAKWAQTLDGRVSPGDGERWVSNERCRMRVHRLRARTDAILIGVGTALADDPMLTARGVARVRRVAKRVVLDSMLRLPMDSSLVKTAREVPVTMHTTSRASEQTAEKLRAHGVEVVVQPGIQDRVDPAWALRDLHDRHGVATVLAEPGPTLLGSLFGAGLVNEAVVHVAASGSADELVTSASRLAPVLADRALFDLCWARPMGEHSELVFRRKGEV